MASNSIDNLIDNFDKVNISNDGLVTLSQKGGPQLYHQGFLYRVSGGKDGKVIWRCIKTNFRCNAKCHTYGNNIGFKYEVFVDENNEHNHTGDYSKIIQLERRRKIKEKAANSDEPPRKILSKFADVLLSKEDVAN